MSPTGLARETQLAAVEGSAQHGVPERAEALLAAIEWLQQARDPAELCQRAALAVLSVSTAAVAVVYSEATGAGAQLAFSGGLDQAAADACAGMLRDLVAAGAASPYLLLAHGATLAAPFCADRVRGAILLERDGGAFGEAEGRAVAEFARQVAVAAASLALREETRRVERIEAAVLDTLCEGVLIAVDGRVELLNRAAAEMFSADRDAAQGSAVEVMWPKLARLLEKGAQLDAEPLRIGGKDLLVTLRSIRDGRRPAAAVVSFTEAKAGEARIRRPPGAHGLRGFEDLIGASAALGSVRELARVAAQSGSSLIIEGESGVGKEVLAQAIHSGGPRAGSPFVAVHCAAIPRDLLESELFGHDAGAFTGANPHGHAGKFELAGGGTLLLDDVIELPLDMQAKLLRVLQERSVTRLGGSRSRPVDVRVIATTNVPLREAVQAGRFRSDLFYRLSVLSIAIPPLRQRRQDIRPLAEHFLRKYSAVHGRQLRSLGTDALRTLESYSWPGNVRELEHWIESEIHFASPHVTCLERLTRRPTALGPLHPLPPVRPVREAEKELYAIALAAASGSISRAARALGVSRGKLYRKLRLYGLSPR